MPGRLGRRPPTDWEHVERYPLSEARTIPVKVPVVLGINWYSNFDRPMRSDGTLYQPGMRGHFMIGHGDLGQVRGGHAICCKPYDVGDGWWDFYDQGATPKCVDYATCRMMSLLNRKRYAPGFVYKQAQLHDEWPGEDYDGTSVRAGCWVAKNLGLERWYDGHALIAQLSEGISEYRWATDWQQVRDALGLPDSIDGVPLLNSWGRFYPHVCHITDEAGARLLSEEEAGEACLVTDR